MLPRLLATLTLTLLAAAPAFAYTDAQGLNAAETAAVEALSDMGILNGYPDGSLRPAATMSRAEFAKMLCQFAAQGQLTQARPAFTDVPLQTWYFGWVSRAVEQGWMEGYPDGSFRPQNTITQQEVAAVLVRLAGKSGADFLWPKDYIIAAQEAGILAGLDFKGHDQANRLTACLMLYALLPKQPPQQQPETLPDGLYLGVVADVFSGGEGPQLHLWELAQNLPLAAQALPTPHTLISYTLKNGRVEDWQLLLDAAQKTTAPAPAKWQFVQQQVLYYSYRNLTVGPGALDTRNYWLGDESLIYLVDSEGRVRPGSRADIYLKQTVILLTDDNDEVRYLFCY